MNRSFPVASGAELERTTMLTGPAAARWPVVPVILVAVATTPVRGTPPTSTLVTFWKFVPATSTFVPPVVRPVAGVTPVTVMKPVP